MHTRKLPLLFCYHSLASLGEFSIAFPFYSINSLQNIKHIDAGSNTVISHSLQNPIKNVIKSPT